MGLIIFFWYYSWVLLYYFSYLLVTVWFAMKPTSTFLLHVFLFFFFFFQPTIVDFVNCEQCICVLFTVPQITLFSKFFIKNGSHNTIYTFKNYFTTVFSVSVFSFSKNKLNPNTPNKYIRYKTCSIQTHPINI